MKKSAIRFSIAVIISAVALYWAFRGQDFHQLFHEIAHINLWWIFIGLALLFTSHFIRAWRWKVILSPIKSDASVWVSYRALIGGYGMNNIVPRSAEVIRPFIFARHEKTYLSSTVATIMVERVVDLISMVIFLMASLFLFPNELARAFPQIANATLPLFAAMTVILVLVLIMVFSEQRTVQIIYRLTRRWPEKLRNAIDKAASEFAIGLQGARAGGALKVVLGTIGIWVFYVLSMFASLYAFPDITVGNVGMVGSFFLRVLSGLAFMIPTPGGMGSYHFFISQALIRIFDVPAPASIAYATVTHAANYVVTTIAGLIIVLAEGVSLKDFGSVLKPKASVPQHEHLATGLR